MSDRYGLPAPFYKELVQWQNILLQIRRLVFDSQILCHFYIRENMQNFWYLLVSLKNLQKEINDQVVFLENFKDNFEKIDTERSIKSVEETLKTYLKVIKRLKD